MYLVDILARDLKRWPAGIYDLGQRDDGAIYDPDLDKETYYVSRNKYELAEDRNSTVTRDQWSLARRINRKNARSLTDNS